MAGFGSRTPNGPITSINVTPLVDITLVLLIIFMVTAKLIVSHNALTVELPPATSGNDVQEVLSIVLTAAGATEVNGEALADEDTLLPRVQAAQIANREISAVINAEGTVHHRRVMHVLDILKQAGVTKIGFGVVPMPAARPEERIRNE
jgi:biopolymer transport protein ExbD